MDPPHATIEEPAADGYYARREPTARDAASVAFGLSTSFRKSRWGSRSTSSPAGALCRVRRSAAVGQAVADGGRGG